MRRKLGEGSPAMCGGRRCAGGDTARTVPRWGVHRRVLLVSVLTAMIVGVIPLPVASVANETRDVSDGGAGILDEEGTGTVAASESREQERRRAFHALFIPGLFGPPPAPPAPLPQTDGHGARGADTAVTAIGATENVMGSVFDALNPMNMIRPWMNVGKTVAKSVGTVSDTVIKNHVPPGTVPPPHPLPPPPAPAPPPPPPPAAEDEDEDEEKPKKKKKKKKKAEEEEEEGADEEEQNKPQKKKKKKKQKGDAAENGGAMNEQQAMAQFAASTSASGNPTLADSSASASPMSNHMFLLLIAGCVGLVLLIIAIVACIVCCCRRNDSRHDYFNAYQGAGGANSLNAPMYGYNSASSL